MEKIPLPSKIEFQKGSDENEAIVSIQPCYPGYGTTLGNALRRVLLSSLPGAAVTAFKVKGVQHEFSTIPHVKEDFVEISLNLKQLRLKVFSEEPLRLSLKEKGEKEVKAKNIKVTSDVEIINPELHLATLTDKNADLDMEIVVSRGKGYVPTEAREEELEIGMIAIDSIFSPIRNVGFKIENVRVGKMTNFENLTLTIETDGTITPQEALNQATKILIEQFNFIEKKAGKEKKEKEALRPLDFARGRQVQEKKEEVEKPAAVKALAEKEEKPKRKRGRPKKVES